MKTFTAILIGIIFTVSGLFFSYYKYSLEAFANMEYAHTHELLLEKGHTRIAEEQVRSLEETLAIVKVEHGKLLDKFHKAKVDYEKMLDENGKELSQKNERIKQLESDNYHKVCFSKFWKS